MDSRLQNLLQLRWVSTELLWIFSVLAAAALAVQITGKGIDILALMMLGAAVVLFDHACGDRFTEILGPTLWSGLLLSLALLSGWGIVKKNEAADRFFRSAERAGYEPLYYDSTITAPPRETAIDISPPNSDLVEGTSSPAVNPDLTPKTMESSVATAVPSANSGVTSAGLEFALPIIRPWTATRQTPVLRIEAPEIVGTGDLVTIRARLTAEGKPIVSQSIAFSVDDRPIAVRSTDSAGRASASFTPRVPSQYKLSLHVGQTNETREASATAILHVIPGKL